MRTDFRLDAMARAIADELFFRRHGMPAASSTTADHALSRALAQVALLAADGDAVGLERMRREREATATRLLTEDGLAVPELCA